MSDEQEVWSSREQMGAEHNTQPFPSPPVTFNIGQVNILNRTDGSDYRYRFLMDTIASEQLDIVTLQEVADTKLLQERLSDGYDAVFVRRNSSSSIHEGDCVGIVYDTESIAQAGLTFERYCQVDFSWLPGAFNGVLARFRDNNVGNQGEERSSSVYVYSGHFMWNMVNEHKRLLQLRMIASLAEYLRRHDPGSVFIIASDINTNEDAAGYAYIVGRQPGIEIPTEYQSKYQEALRNAVTAILSESERAEGTSPLLMPEAKGTFFVDAYSIAGQEDEWDTTDQGNNYWGHLTAQRHGIMCPEMLPQRRIDYILSHGWVYGKRGCPVSYNRFGEPKPERGFMDPLSDHYGISATILL